MNLSKYLANCRLLHVSVHWNIHDIPINKDTPMEDNYGCLHGGFLMKFNRVFSSGVATPGSTRAQALVKFVCALAGKTSQ